MSSLEELMQEVLDVLKNDLTPPVNQTNVTVAELNTEAQKTMKQAQVIMTRLDPILDSITRIEDFVFALLIVLAVMLLTMFLFWFFRHVYPLMRKQHTHPHTADNVIKDLTDTPVRVQSQPQPGGFGFETSLKRDFGSIV